MTCAAVEKSSRQGRVGWVDAAKGIGIILVVFAHVNFTPAILDTIYSFHMPLFFVISGMLYNKSKYTSFWQFLKRRLQTLICPYVLLYMLVLAYTCVYKCLVGGFSAFDWSWFVNVFLQMFLSQSSGKVVSAPLWFVMCLFAVEILYYFISKLDKKLGIGLIAVLVFAGWAYETYILPKYSILLPWSLDSALFALGFYAFGNLTADVLRKMSGWLENQKHPNVIGVGFVVAALGVTAFFALRNGHVTMGSKALNNGFIFYLTGILGSLSVFTLGVLLQKSRFLAYCGRNSFYIMAIHVTIKKTYLEVTDFVDVLAYDSTRLLQTIIPFVVVLGLSLLFTVLYNKVKSALLKKRGSLSAA